MADRTPPTHARTATPKSAGVEMPAIIAWAKQSASENFDCPMSPDEAVAMTEYARRGPEGELVAQIGCACAVELTCDGYARRSCPPAHHAAEMIVHHLGMADVHRDGDAEMAQWADRLYANRKAPLAKVSRAIALPPANRAAYLATIDTASYLATFEQDKANLQKYMDDKLWSSLPDVSSHAHANLALLEKRSCGDKNETARSLVAQLDAVVRAHKKQTDAAFALDDRINADPAYKQLTAQEERLRSQLAELENAHGDASQVCSNSAHESWKICQTKSQLDDVSYRRGKRMDALAGTK